MKDVLIVGAGGFGREIYTYVEDCLAEGFPWRIKGFIDDNLNALDSYNYPHKVVGTVDGYEICENDIFIAALGLPKVKKYIVERLLLRGAKFETFIHPSARVGRNVKLGTGCVLCPGVFVTCDIEMGDFVTINSKSGVGHDAKIGSWTTLSSFCDVTGHAKLGEGVFFSSSAVAMPKSKIGDWAVVGANSGVVAKVSENSTVYGNPAVKM